jgi:RNA polymerase sigma-70 factor (ECF subfamily)
MSADATPKAPSEPGAAPRAEGTPAGVVDGDSLLALVRAAASGHRDALVRLLSLVGPAISATLRVFLGNNPAEMEDALQEVLIAVTESLPRFRGESSFLHYCRRIAVRVALAQRRASRRRSLLSLSPPEALEAFNGGLEGITRDQRVTAFRHLLDELPREQAESLAYRVVLDYPLDVIARETGVPINTVRSRIRLARDYLRGRISADPALAELMREVK